MNRNGRKRKILSILEGRGWLTAGMVAALSDYRPKRAVYRLLNSYRRWGLIRRRLRGGLLVYRVSERGRRRLAWLRKIR